MACTNHTARIHHRADSSLVWREAFSAALAAVLTAHNRKRLAVSAAAHLAAEIADEAVLEYARRYRRPR